MHLDSCTRVTLAHHHVIHIGSLLKITLSITLPLQVWTMMKGARSGRKVFGGASNKDVGYLKSNVARVRLTTKPREDWLHLLCCVF